MDQRTGSGHLLCIELGIPHAKPAWMSDIAAGQVNITTPHEEGHWRTYNEERAYQQRMRPWNFAMTAHPARLHRSTQGPRSLTAPREDKPDRRRQANWIDRNDPTHRTYR